jgi:hypothetical protein
VSLNQPDLDLLAEYVGGALDGTPDEERVGERIRTDAEWAEAYADLVAAFDAVSGDLHAYGSAPEPMPADVWDRLEAALSSVPTASEPPPAYGDHSKASPDFTAPRDNRPPSRSVRKRRRVATPVLAAVAVLFALSLGIFVVKGLPQLADGGSSENSGTAADAPPAYTSAGGAPILQRASGRDYTDENLVLATDFGSTFLSQRATTGQQPQDAAKSLRTESSYASAVPPQLLPLTQTDRLAACLTQVARIMQGQVLGVDYALYQHQPAAMIVVRTPDDARWVGVVGADCGSQSADLLAQKRLG